MRRKVLLFLCSISDILAGCGSGPIRLGGKRSTCFMLPILFDVNRL